MIYLVAAVVLVFATVGVVHFETWLTKKLGMQRRSQFVSLCELEEDPGPLDTQEKLALALTSPKLQASKHLDRIQDAVSLLLAERKVAVQALYNMERNREWMGYQLGAANTLPVDEESERLLAEQLETLGEKYTATVKWDLPTLAEKVSILARLVPNLVDSEFVGTVFLCDSVTASKAVQMSAENDAKGPR
jgi:hypothetical protein